MHNSTTPAVKLYCVRKHVRGCNVCVCNLLGYYKTRDVFVFYFLRAHNSIAGEGNLQFLHTVRWSKVTNCLQWHRYFYWNSFYTIEACKDFWALNKVSTRWDKKQPKTNENEPRMDELLQKASNTTGGNVFCCCFCWCFKLR